MELAELKESWNSFHRRMEAFEEKKERELRAKNPTIDEHELHERVIRSVDNKFRLEAKQLIATHMRVTSPTNEQTQPAFDRLLYW